MIRYFDTDTAVLPGDKVQMKRWFRFVDGTVSHVPGLSKPRREFDAGGLQDVGITTYDGKLYGIVVDPDTCFVRDTGVWVARCGPPEGIPDVIDDPYIENQ